MTRQSEYRTPAEIKAQSSAAMAGRFSGAVMMTLSYYIWIYLISYAGSIISSVIGKLPFFSSVSVNMGADLVFTAISTLVISALNIVGGMFMCGVYLYYLNISTGRDAQPGDIMEGFRENPSRTFRITAFLMMPVIIVSFPLNLFTELYRLTGNSIHLYITIFCLLLSLGLMLYMHLSFGAAYFMMLDFPSYSASKILDVTYKKMKSHRLRLFILELRFVPMLILSFLSMGIGLLWVYPLICESRTLFFLNLMNPEHHIPIDERV